MPVGVRPWHASEPHQAMMRALEDVSCLSVAQVEELYPLAMVCADRDLPSLTWEFSAQRTLLTRWAARDVFHDRILVVTARSKERNAVLQYTWAEWCEDSQRWLVYDPGQVWPQ